MGYYNIKNRYENERVIMTKQCSWLILEDNPIRIEQFKVFLEGNTIIFVTTAMRAIDELKIGLYDFAFLDHDLGGEIYCPSDENSGYAVASWLSEHPDRMPKLVYLHSMNYAGRANMKLALPYAVEIPFSYIADEVSEIMRSKRSKI